MKLTKLEQKRWDKFYDDACNKIVYNLIVGDWLYLWTDTDCIALRVKG